MSVLYGQVRLKVINLSLLFVISGSIYVNDCPIERYIPIFLIVFRVFGILRGLASSTNAGINESVSPQIINLQVSI